LSIFSGYYAGTLTVSANTGTLQSSFPGTAAYAAGGVVTNTSATPSAGVVTSATLSQSSAWAIISIELRSVYITIPAVYFPTGIYNYSSGLAFNWPDTLEGEMTGAAVLCYQGNAHAVDLGPSGLTVNNYQITFYTVNSLGFQCGGSMTEGINIPSYVAAVRITNCQFLNFGNGAAYDVYYSGANNYINLIDHNYFYTWDNVKRNFIFSPTDINSYMRIENNELICTNGRFGGTQCPSTSAGIGVSMGGNGSYFTNNNASWMIPNLQVKNNGISVMGNYFEADSGASTADIEFVGAINGLHLWGNYGQQQATGTPFLGPATGSDTLSYSSIRDTYLYNFTASSPVVALNNLAGQVGNQASGNSCGTTVGNCPVIHTTGSNINAWVNDVDTLVDISATVPTITGTGACATVSTQKGGNAAGTVTCTGTTGASTLIITPGYTTPNGYSCTAYDLTTVANIQHQSATSTTACTLAGTVNQNDVMQYISIGY
jgi:hypothetical protein